MKPFFLIALLSIFVYTKSYSQSLTGTWQANDNSYRIVIIHINDSCFGYTYDTGLGYCKANFKGIFNDSTKKLKGLNTNFIEKTFPHGLSSYQLSYFKERDEEYLKGTATPKHIISKVLSLEWEFRLLTKNFKPV
jgi:hypothetical protein